MEKTNYEIAKEQLDIILNGSDKPVDIFVADLAAQLAVADAIREQTEMLRKTIDFNETGFPYTHWRVGE